MARPRKLPRLDWLRSHLRRTGKARGVNLSDDVALTQFCLSMPTKKWQTVSVAWRVRKWDRDAKALVKKHLEGGAVPLLQSMLKERDERIRQLEKEVAMLRGRYEEEEAA